MFIVTVSDNILKYFTNIQEAIQYAEYESENEKNMTVINDCCLYRIYPRVVIHEIKMNIEYEQNYLQSEIYAIKKYNDFTHLKE